MRLIEQNRAKDSSGRWGVLESCKRESCHVHSVLKVAGGLSRGEDRRFKGGEGSSPASGNVERFLPGAGLGRAGEDEGDWAGDKPRMKPVWVLGG
jgi:hypothetical protein